MSRRSAPPALSPRVFRHFAVVTIAITICLAMFADGESREAIAGELNQRVARNHELQTEADKLGKRKLGSHGLLLREEGGAYLPFAQDVGVSQGAPRGPDGGGTAVAGPAAQAPAGRRTLPTRQGLTSTAPNAPIGTLPGKAAAARTTAAKAPSREEIDALLNAAQKRAGAASQ